MVQHHIMARCPGETVQSVTVQCGHEDSLSTPTGRGSTCPKTMRTFKCFWSRWKPEAKRKPWRSSLPPPPELALCSAEPLLVTQWQEWVGEMSPSSPCTLLTPTLCWRHQESSSHRRPAHRVLDLRAHDLISVDVFVLVWGGWQQGQENPCLTGVRDSGMCEAPGREPLHARLPSPL